MKARFYPYAVVVSLALPFFVFPIFAQLADTPWPMFRGRESMILKLFQSSGFCTIIGVIVGILLGEGSRLARYFYKIHVANKTVIEELKSIRYQIYQKQDLIHKIIAELKRKRILPGDSVNFLTLGYCKHISELYIHLTPLQRNCLHVIYENLRITDNVLSSFENNYKNALRESKDDIIQNPREFYIGHIRDMRTALAKTKVLIKSYLSEHPINVFYVDEKPSRFTQMMIAKNPTHTSPIYKAAPRPRGER